MLKKAVSCNLALYVRLYVGSGECIFIFELRHFDFALLIILKSHEVTSFDANPQMYL